MRPTPRSRLLAIAVLACCSAAAHAQVIGKAGSVELSGAELRRLVTDLPGEARAALVADDASLERYVRSELARRLMLADAKAQGFERDPAASADLERLREETLLRAWLERQSRVPEGYPSEAEVAKAYEAASARHTPGMEYRLAQVFVAAADGAPPAKIAEALRKVAEIQPRLGGDFAQLARQYSEHADSAAKGGDLGLLPESRLLPEVRVAVKELAVGAVVGPVKTAQGLHFVKLVEKKPVPAPSLAEVRTALVAALRQQRATELQREYLARLGQGAAISVNQIELEKLRAGLQ